MQRKGKKNRSLFDFMKTVPQDDDTPNNENNSNQITSQKILSTLKNKFGFDKFRPMQQQIVETLLLKHKDCLCILPTGAGKSLLYQLPAVVHEKGIALVVSPLIALMKDQVDALQQKGIAAEALHSQQTIRKTREIIKDITYPAGPRIRLLFVTPEYLTSDKSKVMVSNLAKQGHLKFFAIDESHCISEWGNSFRSSFLRLGMLKRMYPNIPIIALTATATPKVRQDIQRILQLNNPEVFVSTFNRPEISYSVRYKEALEQSGITTDEDIISYVKLHPSQTGIIYCRKREHCDQLAGLLREEKLSAASFHSGLKKSEKLDVQEGFQSGKYKVIACTIAFGMGIDKSDVRYVIHYELSKSIEGFSQESGRAARDGRPAESIVYYSPKDKDLIEFLIQKEHQKSKPEILEEMLHKLQKMADYCEKTKKCRRQCILSYFGEYPKKDICRKHCDVCAFPREVEAEAAKAQIGVRTAYDARKVRSLLAPNTGDLMNNDRTNPTLQLRDSSFSSLSYSGRTSKNSHAARRKITKGNHLLQQKRSAEKAENQLVAQRTQLSSSDSIDTMFAKLEADERRYNPQYRKYTPRAPAPVSTSRRVTSKTGGSIGFIPASLLKKRKATNESSTGPKSKKRKVQSNLMTRYLK